MSDRSRPDGEYRGATPAEATVDPTDVPALWRAVRLRMAQQEGRTARELAELEQRLSVRRESAELADMSAQLTVTSKRLSEYSDLARQLRRAVIGLAVSLGIAATTCATRLLDQKQLTSTAQKAAVEAAQEAVERPVVVTPPPVLPEEVRHNTDRLDAIEPAVHEIASWVAEQRERERQESGKLPKRKAPR